MRITRLSSGRETVVVQTQRNDPLYVYSTRVRGVSMVFQTIDKNFNIEFSLEEVEKILRCVEKNRAPNNFVDIKKSDIKEVKEAKTVAAPPACPDGLLPKMELPPHLKRA